MKILAERLGVAEQFHERLGEVRRARQRPRRGAVAGHQHLLAGEHAVSDDVALVHHRRQAGAHSVAGADDRPVQIARLLHHRFADDLLLAVNPVRVHRRGAFGDDIMLGRLLVARSRGDEDILSGLAGEHFEVSGHLLRRERHELTHGVERALAERAVRRRVAHVADDRFDSLGQRRGHTPAIEDADLMPERNRLSDTRKRDLAGAADEENIQSRFLF